MRVNKLVFLIPLVISTHCFSQDKSQSDVTDVTKATFFNPGVSYEKRIGKFQTLLANAFLNTSFSIGYSSSLGTLSSLSFDPAFILQYRYYYNYNQRQKKGKRTEMNSVNYLSPTFQTIFSKIRISESHLTEKNRRAINTLGAVWGIQRNYKKRFSLDLNLGGGYLFTTATVLNNSGNAIKENVGKFISLGQLNLGFWLNKRK